IEIGDVVDCAEPGRTRRRAEAGVTRRDDPEALRQPVEKRAVLRDIVAAMQKQQRRAGPCDLRLDRYARYLDPFHSMLLPDAIFPQLPTTRLPGGSRDPPFRWRSACSWA